MVAGDGSDCASVWRTKKKRWVGFVDCVSSPIYKRTVKVSSVIPRLNWAPMQTTCIVPVSLLPAQQLLLLLLSLAAVASWIDYYMQLSNTICSCPLLLPRPELIDAKLRKSNQFDIIWNFRLLQTRCLTGNKHHELYLHIIIKHNRTIELSFYNVYYISVDKTLLYYSENISIYELTSLKVTFLLFWGSSTIFCKLAATKQRIKKWEDVSFSDLTLAMW